MDTYDLFRLYKTLHVIAVVVLVAASCSRQSPGRWLTGQRRWARSVPTPA